MTRLAIILAAALGLAATSMASAGSSDLKQVMTPSRNIGCIASRMEGRYSLRCDIRQHTYPTPARPRSCPLDYGDSLTLGRLGRARWTCHGDTALPPPNGQGFTTIAYGRTWKWGPFSCTSRVSGLTCSSWSGYGFLLSRQKAKGFYNP